jgi:hypothetical protein
MSLNTIAAPRQKLIKDSATVVATTTLVVEDPAGEEGEGTSEEDVDIVCNSP